MEPTNIKIIVFTLPETGFAILHTVTIGRLLQNGDKILNLSLFNILNDLKMTMFVGNMGLINMTN
jgi:hypothetical protein